MGLPHLVGTFPTQTGRFWIEALRTEVLFVTLDKSDKTFSPSTRYEDFALSPTRFHWQSQSTTERELPDWPPVRAPARERLQIFVVRPAEEERPVPVPWAFAIRFPFREPADEHLLGSGASDASLVLRDMRLTSCSLEHMSRKYGPVNRRTGVESTGRRDRPLSSPLRKHRVEGRYTVAGLAGVCFSPSRRGGDFPPKTSRCQPHILADDHLLTYGILVGPELFGQRLIDERYPGGGDGIVFCEVVAAQDGNLEEAQVARRDAHPRQG